MISIWLYGGLEPIWKWYNGLYTADIECSLSMLNAHLTCMDYHQENVTPDRVRVLGANMDREDEGTWCKDKIVEKDE